MIHDFRLYGIICLLIALALASYDVLLCPVCSVTSLPSQERTDWLACLLLLSVDGLDGLYIESSLGALRVHLNALLQNWLVCRRGDVHYTTAVGLEVLARYGYSGSRDD